MTVKDRDELLSIFREFLLYGYKKMSSFPFNENKYRLKKNILYMMMAATQSYSEAILKLMDNRNNSSVYDKAAEVIYRSLVENLINLNYIYSERTQRNAVIFLAYSVHDKNDFAEKYMKLMSKYPDWKLDFGDIKSIAGWSDFIKNNSDLIKSGEKKYGMKIPKKIPDLASRAITHDKSLEKKGKLSQKESLESYYVTYYKFFSQVSHLTMPGLERFYEVNKRGQRTLVIDGEPDSIVRLVSITYQIYFFFLKTTLLKFGLYKKEEFKKYNEFSKSMI